MRYEHDGFGRQCRPHDDRLSSDLGYRRRGRCAQQYPIMHVIHLMQGDDGK